MMNKYPLTLIFLIPLLLTAQPTPPNKGPMTLKEIIEILSDADLLGNEDAMIGAVKRNGLDFELNENTLIQILGASAKVQRPPQVNARLIVEMFQECTECLNRYFGAFNQTQLLAYVRDNNLRPQIALQRVLLRGTKDIPKTVEFVQELKRAGASQQLIDFVVPADEIPLPTPEGYKPEVLLHDAGYDRRLATGFLHVIVRVAGQMDFLFQDNALFTKVAQGADQSAQSKVLKSTITTPLPRNIAPPNFEVYSVFPLKKKKTDAPKIKSENGRIEFTVSETPKEPHIYEIKIKYGVPSNP